MSTTFRYRAATDEGRVIEGVLQAPSQRLALDELRRQRLYPVDVAQLADTPVAARVQRGRMDRAQALALLTRTLATLLHAGVPLDRALAFAAAQTRNTHVAAATHDVRSRVEAGASLAEAMAAHPDVFAPMVATMIAAGEESGALDEATTRLAEHLDHLVELRAQLRSALLYPALIAVTSGLAIIVLLLFVVPRLIGMLTVEGMALPLSTRLLVGVSSVFVHGWWVLLLAALATTFALRAWLAVPGNNRRWHAFRLTWPITGELELKHDTARFARALGLLLRSGLPVLPAFRTARNAVANRALGAALERAATDVSHGRSVREALANVLPPLAGELLAVGEESGRLDELCLQVADTYDAEVKRALAAAIAVLEPALILIFGVIVAFVALAMLQAIYGVNQTFL